MFTTCAVNVLSNYKLTPVRECSSVWYICVCVCVCVAGGGGGGYHKKIEEHAEPPTRDQGRIQRMLPTFWGLLLCLTTKAGFLRKWGEILGRRPLRETETPPAPLTLIRIFPCTTNRRFRPLVVNYNSFCHV